MVSEAVERRLMAVLAADLVGNSRLVGASEEGTPVRWKIYWRELIAPKISEHRGRIARITGEGLLVEFVSAIAALRCAVEIQRALGERNAAAAPEHRVAFRMGINVGEIITDGSDFGGDGVSLAIRLEALAEAGGICISEGVYEDVEGKLAVAFEDTGEQQLKSIARPVRVYRVRLDKSPTPRPSRLEQEIKYCRAPDGVRLAWTRIGQGPPLVRTAHWLTHLEYDWDSPLRRPGIVALARNHSLIRYDARGCGLSDWEVPEISLDAWVSDLETVVEAAGVERFRLLGLSQGCAISIAYVVRHPERVSHLVLYGGFALGRKKRSAEERETCNAMATLMRLGWGADDPAFRQLFTSRMMPDATKEQADAFNELQRRTTTAECAARYYETVGEFDIDHLLAKVSVPTLVMHARGDRMTPFEEGRRVASAIPGARFVALPGNNHSFLPGHPAAARFIEEMELFFSH